MNIDLSAPCEHVAKTTVRDVTRPAKPGCKECLAMGSGWVHLRICLTCGHIGCCDSSPNKHATAHYHATKHPIVTSGETDEEWAFCYVDDTILSG